MWLGNINKEDYLLAAETASIIPRDWSVIMEKLRGYTWKRDRIKGKFIHVGTTKTSHDHSFHCTWLGDRFLMTSTRFVFDRISRERGLK